LGLSTLSHRDFVACDGTIPVLTTATKLSCRLFFGTWPNPTQIIINDFDAIPGGAPS